MAQTASEALQLLHCRLFLSRLWIGGHLASECLHSWRQIHPPVLKVAAGRLLPEELPCGAFHSCCTVCARAILLACSGNRQASGCEDACQPGASQLPLAGQPASPFSPRADSIIGRSIEATLGSLSLQLLLRNADTPALLLQWQTVALHHAVYGSGDSLRLWVACLARNLASAWLVQESRHHCWLCCLRAWLGGGRCCTQSPPAQAWQCSRTTAQHVLQAGPDSPGLRLQPCEGPASIACSPCCLSAGLQCRPGSLWAHNWQAMQGADSLACCPCSFLRSLLTHRLTCREARRSAVLAPPRLAPGSPA